jgi:hypothetical protein
MSVRRAVPTVLIAVVALAVGLDLAAVALGQRGPAMLIASAMGQHDTNGLGDMNNVVTNLSGTVRTGAFILGPLGLAVAAGSFFMGTRRGIPILLTVVGALFLAAMSPTIAA